MSQKINFFNEDIQFTLKNKIQIRKWIRKSIENEGFKLGELNFIFCSDGYLLQINQEYLKHDTYTDIITFDNSELSEIISGDIFISIDRIIENAEKFQINFDNELHRVMIHGVLHLMGYPDKKREEKVIMTSKEDYYLTQRL
ncbi:rRNA maturation RNase YbeY [Albibacterium profundi]|uniref:Endoribonuclease YbeY n=1 Tax=Albibacterium profundi TaxID=3134906 RepID=A0ABV5CDB9_9SPHI